MSNPMYDRINYINWQKEAKRIIVDNDTMVSLIKDISSKRHKAKSNTKRVDFMNEDSYKIDKRGDYVYLYLKQNGEYFIYCNNAVDDNKNFQKNFRADREFERKFVDLNGLTLRKAFGFVDKSIKRCIPKQLYYINDSYKGKIIKASSIDASSQYASGCLGKLPDAHNFIHLDGRVEPSEEWPFAFYKSGHCAEYNVFDTHRWLGHRLAPNLFRLSKDDPYPLTPLSDEEEETILCKASEYEMTDTWKYFYDIKSSKKDSDEYEEAKLIMNKTIGCWHRKDAEKKTAYTYDDHGSYQLAHIVAIAIGRGNQKILNKLDEIDKIIPMFSILHICVDGIIYLGDTKYGNDEPAFGEFTQEFLGADFKMTGINVYCARQNNKCIKFKHGSYDLLDGKEIPDDYDCQFDDLEKLDSKERVGDIING